MCHVFQSSPRNANTVYLRYKMYVRFCFIVNSIISDGPHCTLTAKTARGCFHVVAHACLAICPNYQRFHRMRAHLLPAWLVV
jgi:hypothetical protein